MTTAEKKRWLRSYRRSSGRIERLRLELERWRARAEGLSCAMSSAPVHGSGGDKLQTAVDAIVEVERLLQEDIAELAARRLAIRAAVSAVPDELLREILELYYIDGLSWDAIAERKAYSVRQIQNFHGRALLLVEPREQKKSPAQRGSSGQSV